MKIKATDIIGLIGGGGPGGEAPPQQRVLLRQTDGQSITADTQTLLGFTEDDVIQNVGQFWDSTEPSQFVVPVGIETVLVTLTYSADAAGTTADYSATVRKNGVDIAFERSTVSGFGSCTMSSMIDVEEGDVITPYVRSSSAFTTAPSLTSFGILDVTNGGSGQVAIWAQNAENSASAASSSATTASAAATAAGASATIAQNASITANSAAAAAGTAQTNAQNSATAAATSASNAATSATGASSSATAANNSAVTAASSAGAAGTSALNASNSANAASTHANSASTFANNSEASSIAANNSAVTAQSAANSADGSKTAAQNSATAAATHATTASTHATNAGTSATAANNSAVSAASSANAAGTAQTNAQNSATAAATSATTASTHATNAGSSATAANASALTASSSATNAGTSATNAQNSATAAATSATTASTHATNAGNSATTAQSSSLIAQANASTRGITPNAHFDSGLALWYSSNAEGPTNAIFQASYSSSSNVATTNTSARADLYSAKVSVTLTRKYRLRARIHSSNGTGTNYIGIQCLDNNGATIGSNIGLLYLVPGGTTYPTGWTEITSDVITGEGTVNGVGGWAGGFRAGTKQIRVISFMNYASTASVVMGMDYLYLEDVTESENAALSASAASTSASSASASATAAGNSATAASGHSNTASTAAGTATTKASEAASSATTAQGHANTASSQATLAANSASAAAGSASAASTSAGTASTHATNAGTSASAASGHANTASIKAGEASSSASAAAGSASTASTAASSAQSYAILASSVGPGFIHKNSGFDNYPSNATGQHPSDWTGGTGTQLGYRVADNYGGYSWRLPGVAGADTYAQQAVMNVVKQNDYFVIEADITLNSGTLVGSGVLCYVLNSSSSVIENFAFAFNTTPDQTGVAPGNGVAARTYRFAKLFRATSSAANGLQLYVMSHWSSFGSTASANDITWNKCGIRAATQAEIRDQTVLPALESSVSTLASTVATYDSRLASYVTKVSAGAGTAELALYATDSGGAAASNITLKADKIKLGSISQPVLEISGGQATFTGALNVGGTSGARVNITNNLIRVYDASNVLRVRIGIW